MTLTTAEQIPTHPQPSPRLRVVLPLLIFLLALAARLVPGARTIDDSFITYRYARNILAGQGMVYNPGERVLGTTTPLYTALMVLGGALSGGTAAPFAQIAMLLNAFADGVVCLLLYRMGNRLGFKFAGLGAALAWAIAPYSVTFAIGGLETSLFVLLLVGTACAHLEERHILAVFLAALALLTRPDALIFIGPLAIDRLWQVVMEKRRNELSLPRLLVELLVFLLPTLIWVIFSTLYFGSPLPHSMAAKALAYRLSAESGFIRLLQHYATPFLEEATFGIPAIAVGLFLYPFLYLVGSRRAFSQDRRIWPWLAYPWLYFAIFSLANPLIFRWYMTPPLPAYYLFILAGLEGLILSFASSRSSKTGQPAEDAVRPLPLSAKLVILVLVVLAPTLLAAARLAHSPRSWAGPPCPRDGLVQARAALQPGCRDFSAADRRLSRRRANPRRRRCGRPGFYHRGPHPRYRRLELASVHQLLSARPGLLCHQLCHPASAHPGCQTRLHRHLGGLRAPRAAQIAAFLAAIRYTPEDPHRYLWQRRPADPGAQSPMTHLSPAAADQSTASGLRKRLQVYLPWAIWPLLAILTALALWDVASVPFHPDESTYLYMSSDFDLLLTDPLSLAWTPDQVGNWRTHLRIVDAPLVRYLLGLGRNLAGLPALPVDWSWMKSWEENQAAGALPSPQLLASGRLALALLLPFSLGMIYKIGSRLHGPLTGLLAALLLGSNALLLLHDRRAMANRCSLSACSLRC